MKPNTSAQLKELIIELHNRRFDIIKDKKILNALTGDGIVYMSDMDTSELLYLNEEGKSYFGEDAIGKKCYEALQHRQERCPFCTNDIIKKQEGKVYTWVFKNEVNHRIYLVRDVYIKLINGSEKHLRLEQAIDITEQIPTIVEYSKKG